MGISTFTAAGWITAVFIGSYLVDRHCYPLPPRSIVYQVHAPKAKNMVQKVVFHYMYPDNTYKPKAKFPYFHWSRRRLVPSEDAFFDLDYGDTQCNPLNLSRILTDMQIHPYIILPPADVEKRQVLNRLSSFSKRPNVKAQEEGRGFHDGVNSYFSDLMVYYWRNEFDFQEPSRSLNEFSHYQTKIHGLNIHYMHDKSSTKQGIPILLLHGWPQSVHTLKHVMKGLAKMDRGFQVIAPSLPGFGWSDQPKFKGLSTIETARIMIKLMERLRLLPFLISGEGMGCIIATQIAQLRDDYVIGLHLSYPHVPSGATEVLRSLAWRTVIDIFGTTRHLLWQWWNATAQHHIHTTKPDSVVPALSDSPTGLAIYMIGELATWSFSSATDSQLGGLGNQLRMQDLIEEVMVYWQTGSIGSALRFVNDYYHQKDIEFFEKEIVNTVPTSISHYDDCPSTMHPSCFSRKYTYIVQMRKRKTGGYFPSLERPRNVLKDIQSFLARLEKTRRLTMLIKDYRIGWYYYQHMSDSELIEQCEGDLTCLSLPAVNKRYGTDIGIQVESKETNNDTAQIQPEKM